MTTLLITAYLLIGLGIGIESAKNAKDTFYAAWAGKGPVNKLVIAFMFIGCAVAFFIELFLWLRLVGMAFYIIVIKPYEKSGS